MVVTNSNLNNKIFRKVRSFSTVLFFVILCLLGSAARAQTSALVQIGNKKMASVGGKATPLLWADGITRVADLDAYAATGLNTVVVRLQWRPTDDGGLTTEDLAGPRAFADAAAAKNLQVVYAFPAAPEEMEQTVRTAADSEPYFMLWSSWVAGAMEKLRDTPNLLGWMLPDDPRALPLADDIALQRWARANFAAIEILNAQWKTGFASFDDLSVFGVESRVRTWQGTNEEMSREEVEERARNPKQRVEPWVWHPAALALAQFRQEAYRALLSRWARTVKEIDPLHFVMSGRTPDYAQLLALPAEIDIAVPDIAPGIAENDLATHNPQSIDIARRAGRFAAVPILATAPERMPAASVPRAMQSWIRVALAHGASGIGFSSWADLNNNTALRAAIADVLESAESTVENGLAPLWNAAPQATTAVLLTPLADGQTLQIGRDPVTGAPAGEPRGLYGFGTDLVRGEPSNLVWTLRWGTAFGSVDYLAPDDLLSAELDNYGALLMPQALSLNDEHVAAVARFVASGGAAVADLGLGAAQSGWQVMGMPPAAQALFGVGTPMSLQDLSFNLQSMQGHAAFPTFIGGRQGAPLTAGDGAGGAAFSSPMTFAPTLPGTIPLALAQRLPQTYGGNASMRWLDSTLTLKPVGAGIAVYAPFRLWNSWRAAQTGFAPFHGDLFGRGAAIVQYNASAFVPAPGPEIENGESVYPQMINYPSAIVLFNHRAPQSDPDGDAVSADWQHARVQTPGVGEFLWSHSMCFFPADGEVTPDSPRRPAPVSETLANEFSLRPRLVEINAAVRAQNLSLSQILPVSAQNLGGGSLAATVAEWNEKTVKLAVWPNASAVEPEAGAFNVTLGPVGAARVTVYDASDSTYRVKPNSVHRVAISTIGAPVVDPKTKKTLPPVVRASNITADAKGVLRIELSSAAALVEITPQ
ncbi:MAG TPA: hypothetical protein VF681_02730 [Abditibacteriaceae bacterium]|jgi:hypothetical protein